MGAFNLGRVFLYEWTVNWRFLPEETFVNWQFHVALLALHVLAILCFVPKWLRQLLFIYSLVFRIALLSSPLARYILVRGLLCSSKVLKKV